MDRSTDQGTATRVAPIGVVTELRALGEKLELPRPLVEALLKKVA